MSQSSDAGRGGTIVPQKRKSDFSENRKFVSYSLALRAGQKCQKWSQERFLGLPAPLNVEPKLNLSIILLVQLLDP